MAGKSWVTAYQYNEITEREELEFIQLETFKNIYMNQTVGKVQLGHFWLQSKLRRSVDGVLFDPSTDNEFIEKNDKKYLNLWGGFNTVPKKGNWKITLRHIHNILCHKNSEKFKYIIRWLAWCVQNPDKQAEVAVIFRGDRGTGKSFLFVQMKKIFGKHGMVISDPNRLTGKHTGHFRSVCFLFCDEVYYPGDKTIIGRMNAIITEPYLDIEGKFQDATTNKNRLHICMSTNNEWVIPAAKDERRYYIDTVNNQYGKSTASDGSRERYFNKLWSEMDSGGREAMLHDLLKMNLGDWHPRTHIPETKELTEQKAMSLNAIESAMRTMLEDGVFPGECDRQTYWITSESFERHVEKLEPYAIKFSNVKKARLIKELGAIKGRVPGKGNIRWEFPPLKEMRRNWDKKYGRNEWDGLEEWSIVKTDF
jgi:hypothetical protein